MTLSLRRFINFSSFYFNQRSLPLHTPPTMSSRRSRVQCFLGTINRIHYTYNPFPSTRILPVLYFLVALAIYCGFFTCLVSPALLGVFTVDVGDLSSPFSSNLQELSEVLTPVRDKLTRSRILLARSLVPSWLTNQSCYAMFLHLVVRHHASSIIIWIHTFSWTGRRS